MLTFGDRCFKMVLTMIVSKDVISTNTTSEKTHINSKKDVISLKQMKHFQNYLEVFDEMNNMKEEYEKNESNLRNTIASHEHTEKHLQKKITDLLFEISLLKNSKKRKTNKTYR